MQIYKNIIYKNRYPDPNSALAMIKNGFKIMDTNPKGKILEIQICYAM